MYSIGLNEDGLDFKTIEKEIYKIVCGVGCEIITEVLERLDLLLMVSRDEEYYRNKGNNKIYSYSYRDGTGRI